MKLIIDCLEVILHSLCSLLEVGWWMVELFDECEGKTIVVNDSTASTNFF